MTERTLSDMIIDDCVAKRRYIDEEDVKEFIRLLKETTRKIDGAKIGRTDGYVISIGRMIGIIDKLAGSKLIEEAKE